MDRLTTIKADIQLSINALVTNVLINDLASARLEIEKAREECAKLKAELSSPNPTDTNGPA